MLTRQAKAKFYDVHDGFKYHIDPEWGFGSGERPPINKTEKYEYFNHPYHEEFDFSKVNKRWKKPIGGALSIEPRIKFDFKETAPGPGRYEPDIRASTQKSPTYKFGAKTSLNSLNLLVGTNEFVGPGSYKVESAGFTSIHDNIPKQSFTKDKRKGLNNKVFTKNETYHLYSSQGMQIDSRKSSSPRSSFNISDKDKSLKLGMFPQHMSKMPTKIRIEHPII